MLYVGPPDHDLDNIYLVNMVSMFSRCCCNVKVTSGMLGFDNVSQLEGSGEILLLHKPSVDQFPLLTRVFELDLFASARQLFRRMSEA